jgi:putative ABC transport system permease protein
VRFGLRRPAGRFSSLRPALVLAGRRARRERFRAVAILATLAIPVAAVTATDVVSRTTHLTAHEQLDRTLLGSQAVVDWVGYPLLQTPDPTDGFDAPVGGVQAPGTTPPGPTSLPASLLPAHATLAAEADTSPFLTSATAGTYVDVRGVDLGSPAPAGGVRLRSGRIPERPDQIALSPPLARQLSARVGAVLREPGTGLRLRVVGIVADRYAPGAAVAFTTASTAERLQRGANTTPGETGITRWYVSAPTGVPWRAVEGFNTRGWVVTSRQVVDHPPPPTQVPYDIQEAPVPTRATVFGIAPGNGISSTPPPDRATPAIGAAVLGVMLLLEVVLLAGPAFAVGARRRRHELAVIAAAGGTRCQLIGFVVADGLLLGGIAAVTGAGVGIGAGATWLAVLRHATNRVPGSVSIRGWEVAGIGLLALVSGLLAASVPAISASRGGTARVLRGRHTQARLSWRLPALGALALAAAVALAAAALDEGSNGGFPVPLVLAAALAETGFVLLTPAVLALVGRAAPHLPVWPRLAVRDAARNRSSSAPAVAAIIAVAAAATAALVYGSSVAAHDRVSYLPSFPTGDAVAYLTPEPGVHVDPAAALAAVRAELPGADAVVLDGQATGSRQVVPVPPGCPTPVISQNGSYTTLSGPGQADCSAGFGTDYLVDGGPATGVMLGGPAGQHAALALEAGRAVVFDPSLLDRQGDVLVDIGPGRPARAVVPAVAVPPSLPVPVASIILPPTVAASLNLRAAPSEIYVKRAGSQPSARVQAADQALERLGIDGLSVQGPYHNGIPIRLLGIVAVDLLLTAAATMVTTALVTVDSLDDLAILTAIGAAPRGRRRLTMSRAAVICGIGSVAGVLAGLVPGVGLVWRLRHQYGRSESVSFGSPPFSYPLHIPWVDLVLVVIAAPALATVTAALVHRLTVARRADRRRPAPPGLGVPNRSS